MILLRISSQNEQKILDIARILMEERLVIDLTIKRNVEHLLLEDGKIITEPLTQLTGKTKALLFPEIDKRIKDMYDKEIPDIYSLPIVHMDWAKREQLSHEVQPV
jgi:uncharacterized protein involved in tolerance to divalent cations